MKRKRPSAWDVAKFAASTRVPFSHKKGQAFKKAKIVPGFTRVGGPFARAFKANPSRALMGPLEKKYLDVTTTTVSPITTAGAIVSTFTIIAQGTTEVTRVGGKITVTNFNIRGNISGLSQAAGQVGDIVRIIVFVDKQTNGAAPAVTDLLKTANIYSYLNMDNVDRFQVLKDKFVSINQTGILAATSVYENKVFKVNKKLNMPIHYASTTGAITEVKSNNIYLLHISLTGESQISYSARTKFTDA